MVAENESLDCLGIQSAFSITSCFFSCSYDQFHSRNFSLNCTLENPLPSISAVNHEFDLLIFQTICLCFQIYRGRLKDGSFVVIRCLKMKRSHGTHNFMHHIELISKLRHRHLVSALGHGFEYYLDDSSVSRIFLVFEYVPNGTLRSWISGEW